MLKSQEIDDVVDGAAAAVLTRARFSRVFSQPSTDQYGQDALNVTIVLRNNWATEVNGEHVTGMLVRIAQALQSSGEDRFPILGFATEEDLEQDVGA